MAEVAIKLTGEDNLSNTLKNCTKEIKSMNKAVTDVNAANIRKLDKQFESTVNSGKSVSRQLSEIKKQITEMNYKKLDGTPEFNKMIAKAKELQAAINKTKNDLGGLNIPNGGGGGLSSFINQLGQLKGMGNMSGLIKGMANPFVGIAAAAASAAIAVGKYVDAMNNATKKTQTLTGLSETAARNLNADASVISQHFDSDMNESIRAANALMKTFGISGEQAMKLIQDGFMTGANARGDMLDQLYEYSTYMKEAGINAEGLVSILSQSQKMGVFNDKALDTIKEANLRLREMPKATQDALDAIGLDSTKIAQEIQSGTKSTFDVMKEVSRKISEVGNESQKTGQAIADIFGSAGEDAGYEYITMLKDMELDLDKTKEKCSGVNDVMEQQITAERNLKKATDNLAAVLVPVINKIHQAWTRILNTITDAINGTLELLRLKGISDFDADQATNDAISKRDKEGNARRLENIRKSKKKVKAGQDASQELEGAYGISGLSSDKGLKYGKYAMSNDGRYYAKDNKWLYTDKGAEMHNAIVSPKKNVGGGSKGGKTTKTTKSTPSTTTNKEVAVAGSLGANQKELSDLQSKLTNGLIPNSTEIQDKIKTLKETIEKQEIELGIKVDPQIEKNKREAEKLQNELSKANSEESKLTDYSPKKSSFDVAVGKTDNSRIQQIEQEMNYNDQLIESLKKLQETYQQLGDTSSFDRLGNRIADLTAKQASLGNEASSVARKEKKTAKNMQNFKDAADGVDALGSAFSALGGAVESPELNIAGTIAQAIATMSLSFAEALAQAGQMGPWGWIAFGAAGLAQLITMIASIKSQQFATGGIVGGGSFSGDHNLVRVNSGEMILNGSQQRRVFDILDGKGALGGRETTSTVAWKIKGSDLYGTLRNYSKTAAKTGKNTGIK